MARVALALLVCLVALGLPGHASAHADLRAAEPTPGSVLASPPGGVRLALATEVETEFLDLRVTGPAGAVVSGPSRLDPFDPAAITAAVRAMGDGRYAVSWRVMSRDGHPSAGAYVFVVGAAGLGPAPQTPGRGDGGPFPVLARLLALLGPLVLLGLAVLRFGIVAPAWRAGGLRPPGAGPDAIREAGRTPVEEASRGWWVAWWAFAAVAGAGLLLWPIAILASLDERLSGLGDLITETRFGASWLVQVGALAVAVTAAALLAARPERRSVDIAASWGVALGVGPLIALGAISWGGHASQGADPELGVAIDAIHSWASAAWLGGLVGLILVVPAALGRMSDLPGVRLAAGIVIRFSALAVAAVAAVMVSGVYRALVELSSLDDLFDTAYGRALLVKLVLVALLLVGGAYNRFVVHPRLERAALGLARDDRGARTALTVSVRAELVVALGVMVAVAALLGLPPPA